MFYWPVNCASLVYKLYIAFQIQEHCFYWIVFTTGIFKKVNLFILAYQDFCLKAFGIVIYESAILTYCYFLAVLSGLLIVQIWSVNYEYRIFRTVLYRKINFNRCQLFSYFLLVNKLNELNVFKLQNIFQTFPED